MANGGDLERRPAQKTDAHTSSQELDPQSYSLSPSEGSGARSHYLDRFIGLITAMAFALTTLSTWTGFGLTSGAVFLNGGPTAMIYGTILAGLGTLASAASLAELASIAPVVGAQYRWTGLYAPRGMSPAFLSLMQGWLTVFSWIALCAAVPFVCGIAIQGLIILNFDSYVPQRWHGTMLMWAFSVVPFVCNVHARKSFKAIELVGGVLLLVFYIITVATLVAKGPQKDAGFVFTESFFGYSGWDSEGIQWCIGMLSITSVLSGFDSVIHMSAEVKDAPRKVPKAMMTAVALNVVIALGFIIALLFCIRDVEAVITTPTGFPIIEIYRQATSSKTLATALMSTLLFTNFFSLFGIYASTSRLAWAFAVDKGLPFSRFFAQVHPTLRVPLNALVLVTALSAALGLIHIGSTQAFNAVLALQTLGFNLSYIIPIAFILVRKLEGRHPSYGPFKLGRWGIPINLFALTYGTFICIFLPFPPVRPVTAQSMNYAGPILGAVLLIALVDWVVSGRKRFVVPTSKTEFL